MKTHENNTIVAFHIGRGGRFHNAGYLTYCGEKRINDFTENLFTCYEHQHKLFNMIKGRKNLEEKYYDCCDKFDFSWFKNHLRFDVGELVYVDCSGNPVGLTENECRIGIGCIDIDGQYDTTYTKYLSDCSENELNAIKSSRNYISTDVENFINQF